MHDECVASSPGAIAISCRAGDPATIGDSLGVVRVEPGVARSD